ncbi:hypothetical protein POM88_026068 [Heracleum sosnowskyi]|uniref:Survival motor neuron interacting protein 1 n=1 Tax=Heracleum sosnowskyi TaxID=360622 RepID=A0AAD8MNR1_9APIA|nr:hypothetical protein POM88_026068 [Heracleum sosnowskyi]
MATDHNSNDDLISPVPEKKLKIDPTAYTSLYESFVMKQFEENSKNHLGFSETMENPSEEINYNMNEESKQQDTVSGRRKKARRRAKTRGKGSVENEKGGGIGLVFKCVEVKRDSTGLMYSREQMEGLRFVNKEYQLNKWVEVYCGLGPVVSKEYDALVVHHSEEHGVDFDPRKNFNVSRIMGGRHSQAVDAPEAALELIGCDLDSCTGTEGDCSEDDDSDSEYHSIQRPAFVVTGAPNFDAGPAMDGFEYLRRVRWETERVQKVTFAKVQETKLCEQTVYIPKIPEIVQCPQQLLPLKEWETALLNDFSELRLAISRYESSTSEVSGKMQPRVNILEEDCSTLESEIFHNPTDGTGSIQSSARDEEDASTISSPKILNSEDIANTPTLGKDGREEAVNLSTISCFIQSAAADDEDDSSPKIVTAEDIVNSPTLSTVLGIEPVARVSMLKKRIKLAEDMTSLSKNDCLWLFALCAAVDTPLNADTSASLRDLLRKCASLRAEKSELDDEVVMLNILATIAGKYFGQSDN